MFLHNLQIFLAKSCADSRDLHSYSCGTMVCTLFSFAFGAFLRVNFTALTHTYGSKC